jgi:hypothetical protein
VRRSLAFGLIMWMPFTALTLVQLRHSYRDFLATLGASLYIDSGRIELGQRLLRYGFGAGLSHAGVILEWSVEDRGMREVLSKPTASRQNQLESQP